MLINFARFFQIMSPFEEFFTPYLISTPDFIVLSDGWCLKYQGISENRHSVLVIVSGHTIIQDNPSLTTPAPGLSY